MPLFERVSVMALEVKELDEERREFLGFASTPQVDRAGEIVSTEAMQAAAEQYMTNPLITWMHDARYPIGRATDVAFKRGKTQITAKLTDKTETARDAWGLISDGIVRSLSIGFNPCRPEKKGDQSFEMDGETLVWRKIDWLETAVVSIPCNPGACITFAKGLGLDMPTPELLQDLSEEERFFTDLKRGKGAIEAVRNIAAHWQKEGRLLAPEQVADLQALQDLLAGVLQPHVANAEKLVLPTGALSGGEVRGSLSLRL
jgi:HK97 family phage prohead protease